MAGHAFDKGRMRRQKVLVFTLTFLSYTAFHCTRKVFSVIKSNLSDEEWFGDGETSKLGLLDALFLFCYAFGLLAFGSAGDRFNVIHVLVAGMWASAAVVFLFGAGGFLGIHSLPYYAVLWGICGAVQSVGWPANVAVMGNWFRRSERGAVLGVWSGNASFGNIVGTGMSAAIMVMFGTVVGWKVAMTASGVVVFVQGALCWLFLVPHPSAVGLPDVNLLDRRAMVANREALPSHARPTTDSKQLLGAMRDGGGGARAAVETPTASGEFTTPRPVIDTAAVAESDKRPISFWQAWCIPGVAPYALAYACLKAVNYALFFWLPLYLHDAFSITDSQSDLISMLYDAGQIVGGWTAGMVSDRLGVRSPVAALMMLCASLCLWFFNNAGLFTIKVLLPVTGFLMGGPANLISATIAADLGTHPRLAGNEKALATVTSIIDGTGSVGAAFVQYLVGYLVQTTVHCETKADGVKHCTHWDAVFYMLVIGDILAAACLSLLVFKDLRHLYHRCGRRPRSLNAGSYQPVSQ